MSIRDVLSILLIVYFLVGIILWNIGLRNTGGVDCYKRYLVEELKMSTSTYYIAFVIFVFAWPAFIRKG